MSRTTRRTKQRHCYSPYYYCFSALKFQEVSDLDRRHYPGLTDKQIIARRLHAFHGDNHPGMYSPPSSYVRKYHNRPYRRNERLALLHHVREDKLDCFSNTPNPQSAGRNWW